MVHEVLTDADTCGHTGRQTLRRHRILLPVYPNLKSQYSCLSFVF